MNAWLLGAAALVFVIGLVHSLLGERMIFRHLRQGGLVPTAGAPVLREYQTRILWATWHVVTLFGWALAAVLAWLAQPAVRAASAGLIEQAVMAALVASAGLVLVATRGRHVAWVALLAAAVLVAMA